MSTTERFRDGVLREKWDDATRTYTAYDATGKQTSTRPYTTAENTAADAAAVQAATITDLTARVKAIEDYLFAKLPVPTDAQPWTAKDWPPGSKVTYQGKTYINQTSSWLNALCVPGDALHPFWSEQAAASVPWVVGMALTTGLVVSNLGHIYKWAQANVASAPANYEPTGTVSTASWTFLS